MKTEDLHALIDKFIVTSDSGLLLNIDESEHLDFKGALYANSPDGRYELAKDVSSFANSSGGYLIIGVKTRQNEKLNIETSESIQLVKDETSRIKGCISDYIYPKMKLDIDYSINFIPDAKDSSKGVIAINVYKSQPRRLIAKLTEESAQLRSIVFGYAIRKGDSSIPDGLEDLHKKMQSGFNLHNQTTEQIAVDVALIKEMLESGIQAYTDTNESLDARMDT